MTENPGRVFTVCPHDPNGMTVVGVQTWLAFLPLHAEITTMGEDIVATWPFTEKENHNDALPN